MSARLFVAIPLDDDARAQCTAAAERLRGTGWRARWVDPENYHLTVAFLGTVEEGRSRALASHVRAATAGCASFALDLDVFGGFPDRDHPRVAWLGPQAPSVAFDALCAGVRAALGPLGFTFDADAAPHVTLARAPGDAPLPPLGTAPISVAAREVVLYRSHLAPSPTRYETVERFPLGA